MIETRLDMRRCAPAVHGGAAHEARVRLDFSSNINAWGQPPLVRQALRQCNAAAYPDPEARAARQAAARHWRVPLESIAFLPGAADAIHRVARAFLTRGDTALIAAPAFGEYARAVHAAQAQCIEVRVLDQVKDVSLPQVSASAAPHRPRLIFLASPTSPLGHVYANSEIRALLAESQCLLVLDESYRSFAAGGFVRPGLAGHERVIHIRSITKDFALAGVRAAFVSAHPEIIAAINAAGPPWATSTPAQEAAVAALKTRSLIWFKRTVGAMRRTRRVFLRALGGLPVTVHHSRTNYVCLTLPDAAQVHSELLEAGLAVRHCESFGLSDTLRMAVRRPAEMQRLLQSLRRLL